MRIQLLCTYCGGCYSRDMCGWRNVRDLWDTVAELISLLSGYVNYTCACKSTDIHKYKV